MGFGLHPRTMGVLAVLTWPPHGSGVSPSLCSPLRGWQRRLPQAERRQHVGLGAASWGGPVPTGNAAAWGGAHARSRCPCRDVLPAKREGRDCDQRHRVFVDQIKGEVTRDMWYLSIR